jgi:MFS family permease
MKKKIFYGWWIVISTNVICLLGFGTWLYSFGVFFKPMMSEFGWTRAMTAGAYSLRSIEGGIASPVVGWAVDKYGPRIVIVIGAVIAGAGFCMMPLINSLLGFYMIYGVLLSIGMSAMLYIPAFTLIARWFKRKVSMATSVLAIGAGIGGLICAPISALLIANYGWRISFVLIGITVWVVVIPLTFIIRNSPEEMNLRQDGDPPLQAAENVNGLNESETIVESEDYTLKQALSSSVFWLLALSGLFQGMAHSTIIVHSIPHLTDMGIPTAQAAASIGLLTLVSIIGRVSYGYLGDRFDKRYLFVSLYILQAIGILVLMDANSMMMVYLFIFFFGVGFGGGIPLNTAIRAEYFGRAAFGKIMGFGAPVGMISSAIGPVMAGHIYDVTGSYHYAFLTISILVLCGTPAIMLLRKKPVNP